MLKTMRRNVKSLKPVLWLVVITFIVAIFAIWGGGVGGGKAGAGGALAVVGGAKISADDYFQALRQRLEAISQQFGEGLNAGLIQQLGVPQQTLEQLIQQRLLREIARDMGLRATDAEVRDKIVSFPALQQDGQFVGFESYRRILEYSHIPLADFESSLRQEAVIEKVVQVLTAGIFVTEDEIWEAYRKKTDSAKIEYLVAETAKVDTLETPTEAELRAHFEKNAGAYKVPEKRTGDYVVLKTADLKKEVTVTDSDIAAYYEDNAFQFQEPEQVQVSRIWLPFSADDRAAVLAQASELRERAAGGEDFAGLARSFSKDDKAAADGDWGLYDWRSLSAAETEAIGRLDAGGVSDIVETETGAAVFKVTAKTPAVSKPLDEVSATIRGILEDEKARALVAERIQRLEKLARKEKSLDVAAQKEGLKPASTGALRQGAPLGDFDQSGAVSEALFALEPNEISSPIFTYEGEALAQLKAIEPERPATFEEVRDQVAEDIQEVLRAEKALAKIRDVRAAAGDNWSDKAVKFQVEYKFVEAHKKEQYLSLVGDRAEVDGLIFSLPLDEASEPVVVDEGYAVFRVLERTEATREEFDKVKAEERETLLEEKKNKFLHSYLAKVRQEKNVRINAQAFQRLTDDVLSRYTRTP
jgi:peptidyl-prolyl cis-trans isomerase D